MKRCFYSIALDLFSSSNIQISAGPANIWRHVTRKFSTNIILQEHAPTGHHLHAETWF